MDKKIMIVAVMIVIVLSYIPVSNAEEQRPVYVISDGIMNNAIDNARINQVVKALSIAGVKKVYNGYPGRNGVKVNNYVILSKTPKNAVIVQIMGGYCAATIYSMTMENYYKNLKGSRIIYPIWVYPSVKTDLKNIKWLGRSGDDGGHGAFSGISYPAQKLKNAGYSYAYWKTQADFDKAVKEISVKAGVPQKKATVTSLSVGFLDILKSSSVVQNYVESKKTVPTTVMVGSKKVTKEQYFYILSSTVTNLNKNSKTSVTVKTVSKAPKPVENVKTGTLSKSEYVALAGETTCFVNSNGRVPNYIITSKGKMNPDNFIYTYSKVVAFYKTNNHLPSSVSVKGMNQSCV